ncbi:MAG: hypothetical protein K0S41_1753 [Anaerocolumna sp.]|jgi:hypothetical protein|nr:hypothetical protein [Anaerocolumna sp.]
MINVMLDTLITHDNLHIESDTEGDTYMEQ